VLLTIAVGREVAPARQRASALHEYELRIARDRLTAGLIDADQYEAIVDALRR
jgi:uncharacterized membrane protein